MSPRFELRGEQGPELIELPPGCVLSKAHVASRLNGLLDALGIEEHEFIWEERGDGHG